MSEQLGAPDAASIRGRQITALARLHSEVGRGATAKLYFPKATEIAEAREPP